MPWEEIAYTTETIENPHVTEFLTTMGKIYVNGGVIFRSFRPIDEARFDFALRHDFRGISHASLTLLTSPSVVAALPELQIQLPLDRPPEFHWISPFGLEGKLTNMLLLGGAYERFRGTVEQARGLSRRFMEAIFGEEQHQVGCAGGSPTPWTPWFNDIAWDATFVIQDIQAKRFVLLCMTDTD